MSVTRRVGSGLMWEQFGAAVYVTVALLVLTRWVERREFNRVDVSMFHVEPRPAWVACGVTGSGAVIAVYLRGSDPSLATALVVVLPFLVALAVVDLVSHRLPDALTAAVALAFVGAVGWAPIRSDDVVMTRLLAGVVALGGLYLVLALVGGGSGLGLGDAKLAPTLGGLAVWKGWTCWALAAAIPFVAAGVWGGVLLLRGRGRDARMPLGPFMIAGTLVALGCPTT